MEVEPVTIIGAGPAGMATALQLKRGGIDFLLLEKNGVGGLLRNANWVENYPGFPGGISGLDLVSLFERHLGELAINVVHEEVKEVSLEAGRLRVKTSERQFYSRIVVVGSGTKPRTLADPEIPASARGRVHSEVFPLRDVEGKSIAIVGGGDAAFDYALQLGRKNEVVILNREATEMCLPLLKQRAEASLRIRYRPSTRLTRIACEDGEGLRLECAGPEGITEARADDLLVAIGREPQLDFLSAQVQREERELTRRGALHFIGDVRNGIFRQTAIAVGDGIRTAMLISQRLQEGAL